MKLLSLFQKKARRAPAALTPAARVASFRAGSAPCEQCGALMPLTAGPALEMVPCPDCGAPHLLPRRLAGFWLFSPLGAGGMGAVYKAVHEDRPTAMVAVKILPRDGRTDPNLIDSLTREADITRQFSGHPCVANLVDTGCEEGEYYLATEFLAGERLDRRIARMGKLPTHEVLLLGLRLLAAEAHIYSRGYLYRDMKPENVIITEEHGAVLFDYGIAQPLHQARYHVEDEFDGSPLYFPPERVMGTGEEASSEIYSLGMVLFHAAAGHTYVEPTITKDELRSIAQRHLSSLRTGAEMKAVQPPPLAQVIERMIQREPRDRYHSFLEAETALLKVFESQCLGRDDDEPVARTIVSEDAEAEAAAAARDPVDFQISCRQCQAFLTVSDEFVGDTVQCPACDHEMLVPAPGKAAKVEARLPEVPRPATPAEVVSLQARDPELLQYLEGATNKNCWEFGLLARLLGEALQPLHDAIAQTSGSPGIAPASTRSVDLARRTAWAARGYLRLQLELGPFLDSHLAAALHADNAAALVRFSYLMELHVAAVVEWHATVGILPASGDAPFPELLALLRDWAEHWAHTLEILITQLHQVYEESGATLDHIEPQPVLTPPTLPRLLTLQREAAAVDAWRI